MLSFTKLSFLLFITLTIQLHAKTITDDYGRVVSVPEKITKIYASSPPLTMSLLAFDPKLIASLNFPFSQEQKPYAGVAYDKPVAGGFFGQGQSPNFEALAASKPDVIIVWGRMTGVEKIIRKFSMLNIPVLLVRNDTIKDLVTQFELYGKLTGNTKRAKELIDYTKETLTLVDSLQEKLKKFSPVRYYFAEGVEGLNSECDGSFHLEPFLYAGAKNALDCKISSNYGMEKVSAETVLLSNPDVIIAMERPFYDGIYKNERFASLDAIKNKKVYLVPSQPFNYITRPPSFMRLMGIRWLIHTFYPTLLKSSCDEELQRFEKIFFPSLYLNSYKEKE
jgi:iron complex transport system substrate-binding protein